MYDLILLAILVLPLATVHLAGHFLARDFERLAPEQQAIFDLFIHHQGCAAAVY